MKQKHFEILRLQILLDEIKRQKSELEKEVLAYKILTHPKVVAKSKKLDVLVTEYYRKIKLMEV